MSTTLQLRILLFAGVRDAAKRDDIEIQVANPSTAADVIRAVAQKVPDAAALIDVSRLAVAGKYVAEDHVIDQVDVEFALIPPVSGG